MLKTIEAVIKPNGQVQFKETVKIKTPRKILVTFLDEILQEESALLSESVLARDWLRPEEDQAWSHLQKEV